ncbi:hypothetical protein SMACR_03632 [Sordaria macrospora]|uniref:Uncharacterized protein n=1 Tax=Sordaria macrospora TaxID=5147 RepID=A0A8S9A2C3_SORMA|nr:hypothetical protein SMACR_03632 [Sordaria macrospora]WPJ66028.1 hypothetical protein SMAC4_03632 [Sordaria macrospora]
MRIAGGYARLCLWVGWRRTKRRRRGRRDWILMVLVRHYCRVSVSRSCRLVVLRTAPIPQGDGSVRVWWFRMLV